MDANQNTEISLAPSQTSQNQPRPFFIWKPAEKPIITHNTIPKPDLCFWAPKTKKQQRKPQKRSKTIIRATLKTANW